MDAGEDLNEALRLSNEREVIFDEWLRGEVTADKRPPVPIDDAFKRACGASSRGDSREA
jgi:hypothetical protein